MLKFVLLTASLFFPCLFFKLLIILSVRNCRKKKDTPAKVNRVLHKEVKMQCTKWQNLNGLNLHRFCTCYLHTYRLLCLLWIGWLIWNDRIYFTHPPGKIGRPLKRKKTWLRNDATQKNLGPFAFKADHNRVIGTAWSEGWQKTGVTVRWNSLPTKENLQWRFFVKVFTQKCLTGVVKLLLLKHLRNYFSDSLQLCLSGIITLQGSLPVL